jgi:hypothetical protein
MNREKCHICNELVEVNSISHKCSKARVLSRADKGLLGQIEYTRTFSDRLEEAEKMTNPDYENYDIDWLF